MDYQINLNGKVDAGLGRVWITLCEWGDGGYDVAEWVVCLKSGH